MNNSATLLPTVFLCRQIAADAHAGQTRRNGKKLYEHSTR